MFNIVETKQIVYLIWTKIQRTVYDLLGARTVVPQNPIVLQDNDSASCSDLKCTYLYNGATRISFFAFKMVEYCSWLGFNINVKLPGFCLDAYNQIRIWHFRQINRVGIKTDLNCVYPSSINSLRKQIFSPNGIRVQCTDPFTFNCIIK